MPACDVLSISCRALADGDSMLDFGEIQSLILCISMKLLNSVLIVLFARFFQAAKTPPPEALPDAARLSWQEGYGE